LLQFIATLVTPFCTSWVSHESGLGLARIARCANQKDMTRCGVCFLL
jgi:hypothetical protein